MSKKINKTSYTFLLVLKYILENNHFEIDKILNYLEIEHDIFVYKETILKYLRTLKYKGFKLKKIDYKTYQLMYSPFGKNIPLKEKMILSNLNSDILFVDEKITKTLEKIQTIMPEISDNLKLVKTQENKIKKFQNLCKDKLRLKITYKEGNVITTSLTEPYEKASIDNIWYLKVYDVTHKEQLYININNILKVNQTPTKNKYEFKEKVVTLKFYQPLAKTYVLKENEKIIEKDENYLYVSSIFYDKKLFFNNILRYMDKCEIVSPQYLRDDFRKYIEELYEMYDCLKQN